MFRRRSGRLCLLTATERAITNSDVVAVRRSAYVVGSGRSPATLGETGRPVRLRRRRRDDATRPTASPRCRSDASTRRMTSPS